MNILGYWAARLITKLVKRKALRARSEFQEATKRPRDVQRQLLLAQIRREQETQFGQDHHFSEIRSIEDYRKRIPITTYDYFEPYIAEVREGNFEALFHRQKVHMFALTSGTSNTRKFIPVTSRFLQDYRRGWTIWGLYTFQQYRELFLRSKTTIASNHDEFRTPAGIPCGSISGLTARMQNRLIRNTYCLPPESAQLRDIHSKYYLAWRLGLLRDVGMWISPNPSTLLNLARYGNEHRDMLIRDIFDGTVSSDISFPDHLARRIRKSLRPNPQRARELEAVVEPQGVLRPQDVWPNFGLIGCWTGGSVGAYLRGFSAYFGDAAIRDIGLIASEARMTVPIEDGTASGILEITGTFFEFIPVAEIDAAEPTVLEAHELQQGEDYYILLTTSSGLYRYNIFDVVRCTGWYGRTPLLQFLHKGHHISSITGEKVSEYQVAQATEQSLERLNLKLTAYTVAPWWNDRLPYYCLFVETTDFANEREAEQLAMEIDRRLQRLNSEYETKRRSRRLGPMRIAFLPAGTWSEWDRKRIESSGGTAEQYKHPCLIPDMEFRNHVPVLRTLPSETELISKVQA